MKKINQIQIAERAGITQSYLSKILSGDANPTVNVLLKVSKHSGIKVSKLVKIFQEKALCDSFSCPNNNKPSSKREVSK